MRLDKLLAERGMGSRKDARRLVKRGLVVVDGEVAKKVSDHVDPTAVVTVNGQPLEALARVLLYHKPVGRVSSMDDDWGRGDLSSVLPPEWAGQYHPVGRLDADTSGLLLFSRDGTLTHRLLHPKFGMEREYVAVVEDEVLPDLADLLEAGVETAEGIFCARLVHAEGRTLRLVVKEGKHRMVRRMLNNAGYPVLELHRVRYGPFELGDLEEEAFAKAPEVDL